jgi:hypothetical protein
MNSGNLNFLEPSGPLRACNGTALPLRLVVRMCTEFELAPDLQERNYFVCRGVFVDLFCSIEFCCCWNNLMYNFTWFLVACLWVTLYIWRYSFPLNPSTTLLTVQFWGYSFPVNLRTTVLAVQFWEYSFPVNLGTTLLDVHNLWGYSFPVDLRTTLLAVQLQYRQAAETERWEWVVAHALADPNHLSCSPPGHPCVFTHPKIA